MIDAWLILVGGVLGSSHCLGMCGGFALSIGAGADGWAANLRRQLAYSSGRIFTYGAAGALTGYASLRFAQLVPPLMNAQATLAIAAGGLLVLQGLKSTGLIRWPKVGKRSIPCLATHFFAPFLTAPGLRNAFLAGMLTGFLPCGLVYAYLALAASSGTMPGGLACMVLFGLGTVPAMVLLGCGTSFISLSMRRNVFRIAAWCVVITGILSIARGATALRSSTPERACPFCDRQVVEAP